MAIQALDFREKTKVNDQQRDARGRILPKDPDKKANYKTWLDERNWNKKHNLMLELRYEGKLPKEIAAIVGCSANTVNRVMLTTFFKNRLKCLQDRVFEKVSRVVTTSIDTNRISEAREILDQAAPDAAKIIVKIAKGQEAGSREQLAAAKDILDRCGLKPIEVVETHEKTYTPDEVLKAAEALKEAQAIMARLANQPSPFIKTPVNRLESSVTDISSDVPLQEQVAPQET